MQTGFWFLIGKYMQNNKLNITNSYTENCIYHRGTTFCWTDKKRFEQKIKDILIYQKKEEKNESDFETGTKYKKKKELFKQTLILNKW